jgi:hypothetical protein
MVQLKEEPLILKNSISLRCFYTVISLLSLIVFIYLIFFNKPDNNNQPNLIEWVAITLWVVIWLFLAFNLLPYSYHYITPNGIGMYNAIGFTNKLKIVICNCFVQWDQIQLVDYFDVPAIGFLSISKSGNESVAINVNDVNNKKTAIKILLEKLPRDKATEASERCFFQKWERKFEEEEQKNVRKQLEHEIRKI